MASYHLTTEAWDGRKPCTRAGLLVAAMRGGASYIHRSTDGQGVVRIALRVCPGARAIGFAYFRSAHAADRFAAMAREELRRAALGAQP